MKGVINAECFLLAIVLSTCHDPAGNDDLNGSWRTVEDPPYDTDKLYDSVIFSPPNNLSFYYIDSGRIAESATMQYFYDRQNKLLKVIKKLDTSTFQIIKLEAEIMELKPIQSSRVTKYYRIR
jgi:hypothetical protein